VFFFSVIFPLRNAFSGVNVLGWGGGGFGARHPAALGAPAGKYSGLLLPRAASIGRWFSFTKHLLLIPKNSFLRQVSALVF